MPASSKVRPLQLGDGSAVLYIETVHVEDADIKGAAGSAPGIEGESTEIGFGDTLALLRGAIAGIGASLRGAVAAAKPDELSVDLNFGIKGETKLAPVLLNGAGEGSIRVTIKWKNLGGGGAGGDAGAA